MGIIGATSIIENSVDLSGNLNATFVMIGVGLIVLAAAVIIYILAKGRGS